MKFTEAVEVVSRGIKPETDSWNRVKAFKLDSKGPAMSLNDIENKYPRTAKILRMPGVQKSIAKYLDKIHKDDPETMDISLTPEGDVIIKDDATGNTLTRITPNNTKKEPEKKGLLGTRRRK